MATTVTKVTAILPSCPRIDFRQFPPASIGCRSRPLLPTPPRFFFNFFLALRLAAQASESPFSGGDFVVFLVIRNI